MSGKVTEKQPAELDPKQVKALECLLRGSTATEAAQAANVNRRTLWLWQRSNLEFQAALNRGRREAWEAAELRLQRLAESAIRVVEQALDQGDVRAALAILRGLGLLGGAPIAIGPDEADSIARQARINESERRQAELLAELGL
jgi:hypothetical protein